MLDEFLEWENHTSHVAAKVSSGNYILNKSKNLLPINIRKNIYNSLVRSHMEFGMLAWGNALPGKLKKIKSIQKKCIRNIAGRDIRSHTNPLYKQLNILEFDDLLQYNILTFMHKYFLGKQPNSFENFFKKPVNFESEINRNKFCYALDKLKNNGVGRFPSAVFPRAWNNIDTDSKIIKSHKSFKKFIYQSFIDSYIPVVKCKDRLCPDCFP